MSRSLLLLLLFPLSSHAADKLVENTRQVVQAIVAAAEKNARAPERKKGDELSALYIQEAAAAAAKLPKEEGIPAFLVALGVALDDSTLVRDNFLFARLYRQIESDAERKRRLEALDKPTLRKRRDLCQHFAVSAALVQIVGVELAEAAGLLKEQRDMQKGGSGFSFVDLCVDYAGVQFAAKLKKGDLTLDALAKGFATADYVPDISGLREDLTREQFTRDYGSFDDERFKKEVAELRKRIEKLPAYRK